MKKILLLLKVFLGVVFLNAQSVNLLPVENWTTGIGTVAPFSAIGGIDIENERLWGLGPHGVEVLLWQGDEIDNSNSKSGGFKTNVTIDPYKTYRLSMWVKSESNCYKIFYGTYDARNILDQDLSNIYFWLGDVPELDKWYLFVAYVHATDAVIPTHRGGMYDGETGEKVVPFKDFKHKPTSTSLNFRFFRHHCYTAGAKTQFWAPRIEEVNGNEPTVTNLLGLGSGLWNANGDAIYYDKGSVGIGLDDPAADPDYDFLVDGKIKTKEVKVSPNGWADFVFQEDYPLPPLNELENYIQKNKHLPDIPSEAEVKKEGMLLGEMDRRLLQKIEELTLYLIDMEKRMQRIEAEIKN